MIALEHDSALDALADGLVGEVVDGLLLHLAVLAAYEVGLLAALVDGPLELPALARATGLGERETASLAAAAVEVGLVVRGGRLALSPIGRRLVDPASDRYAGSLFELGIGLVRSEYRYDRLVDALRRPAAASPPWLGWVAEAGSAAAFTAAMDAHSAAAAARWPLFARLDGHRRLLDVAGGSGVHALGAVAAWPQLEAVVLELPDVAPVARQAIARRGLADRIPVVAADMWHDPWPNADVHFFADVLHDWPPERAAALLERSFAALPPGGRVLIHEMLLDDDRLGPAPVIASDLAMLLVTGGRQYSRRELLDLVAGAGFGDAETHPVIGHWTLVEAVKR